MPVSRKTCYTIPIQHVYEGITMEKLSFSMENYLEAVYELSQDGAGARVTDIAQRMGVTKASTNNAMAVLAEKGLIINEKYQDIHLTDEGRQRAKLTSQKHAIIRRLLIEVLGVDPATAEQDACEIEHVISIESVCAMDAYASRLLNSAPACDDCLMELDGRLGRQAGGPPKKN